MKLMTYDGRKKFLATIIVDDFRLLSQFHGIDEHLLIDSNIDEIIDFLVDQLDIDGDYNIENYNVDAVSELVQYIYYTINGEKKIDKSMRLKQ